LSIAPLPKILDTFAGELNLLFLRPIAEHFDKWMPVIKAGRPCLRIQPAPGSSDALAYGSLAGRVAMSLNVNLSLRAIC